MSVYELTPNVNFTYPRMRRMADVTPEEKNDKKNHPEEKAASDEVIRDARQKWAEFSEMRKKAGRDVPEAQRQEQERLARQGITPKELVKFFETKLVSPEEFHKTKVEIEDQILAGRITHDDVKNNEELIYKWAEEGKISEMQAKAMAAEFDARAAEVQKQMAAALVAERIDRGKKAYEKWKRGEKLDKEDGEALKEAIEFGYVPRLNEKPPTEEETYIKNQADQYQKDFDAAVAQKKIEDWSVVELKDFLGRAYELRADKTFKPEYFQIPLQAVATELYRRGEGETPWVRDEFLKVATARAAAGLSKGSIGADAAHLVDVQNGIINPLAKNAMDDIISLNNRQLSGGAVDISRWSEERARVNRLIDDEKIPSAEGKRIIQEIDNLEQEKRERIAEAERHVAEAHREQMRRGRDSEKVNRSFTESEKEYVTQLWLKRDKSQVEADALVEAGEIPLAENINPIEIFRERLTKITDGELLKSELAEGGSIREELMGYARSWVQSGRGDPNVEAKLAEYEERIDKIAKTGTNSIEILRQAVNENVLRFLNVDRDKAIRSERSLRPHENFQEVLSDIMTMTGGDYARGGKYELMSLNKETGEEVIHQANFLRWLRKRMWEFHDSDVDNPVNMFERIYIVGGSRQVSISEMIFNESMFTDKHTGEYLKPLRDKVYYELWLFGTSRDLDAIYRQIMGSDEELPKKLREIYARNTFTKEQTFDTILSLANVDSLENDDFKDDEALSKNQETGKALRRALLSYYYISDEEMLHKIEGESRDKSVLFNNKIFLEQYIKAKLRDQKAGESDADFAKEERKVIYEGLKLIQYSERYLSADKRGLSQEYIDKLNSDPDHNPKYARLIAEIEKSHKDYQEDVLSHEKNPEGKMKSDYLSWFNPFNLARKDLEAKNETKERMRLFIMEESKKTDNEKIKGKGISYDEARYAESFAYSITRWSGAAAKNDTTAVGFDSWTKVMATEAYRKRQTANNRGGVHGNPYSFPGFKQIGVDFLVGATDKSGKSILEIIQGGQGEDIGLDKDVDPVHFGDVTMGQFAENHIAKTFTLFHQIVESHEFAFDKFLTLDNRGRLLIDHEKANSFMDDQVKSFRYAYSTWDGIDYSKIVRVRIYNELRNPPGWEFRKVSLGEAMWGKQVWMDYVNKKRRKIEEIDPVTGEKTEREQTIGEVMQENDAYDRTRQNRAEFFKRPLMYAMAAEIRAHRMFESGYKNWSTTQVEEIYEFLGHFAGDLEVSEWDMSQAKRTGHFFSKEDIEWIRQASGTGRLRMFVGELLGGLIEGGIWDGGLKALKVFFTSLDKTS